MKKIVSLLAVILLAFLPIMPLQAENSPRVVDEADLLSPIEEAKLLHELNEISTRQQFDVVVVTTTDTDGKSAMAYADDFYDYNDYGFGENYDGVLLLIDMGSTAWWISTTGYGIEAITDSRIDDISEEFLPYLSGGYYYEAFSVYADLCDEFVTQAREGEKFPFVQRLFLSMGIGIVIGFIGVMILKGKMKSVRRQSTAGGYVTSGGLNLHTSRDRFLYVHMDRERLPDESRSGGSSIHIGSSGRSHGGGGGRF